MLSTITASCRGLRPSAVAGLAALPARGKNPAVTLRAVPMCVIVPAPQIVELVDLRGSGITVRKTAAPRHRRGVDPFTTDRCFAARVAATRSQSIVGGSRVWRASSSADRTRSMASSPTLPDHVHLAAISILIDVTAAPPIRMNLNSSSMLAASPPKSGSPLCRGSQKTNPHRSASRDSFTTLSPSSDAGRKPS